MPLDSFHPSKLTFLFPQKLHRQGVGKYYCFRHTLPPQTTHCSLAPPPGLRCSPSASNRQAGAIWSLRLASPPPAVPRLPSPTISQSSATLLPPTAAPVLTRTSRSRTGWGRVLGEQQRHSRTRLRLLRAETGGGTRTGATERGGAGGAAQGRQQPRGGSSAAEEGTAWRARCQECGSHGPELARRSQMQETADSPRQSLSESSVCRPAACPAAGGTPPGGRQGCPPSGVSAARAVRRLHLPRPGGLQALNHLPVLRGLRLNAPSDLTEAEAVATAGRGECNQRVPRLLLQMAAPWSPFA